jgi:DNA mismatch repair protein MutS
MTLIKEYFELTEKYQNEYGKNTIVLMQVGAFFEVYGMLNNESIISGSQIRAFSQICDLNIANKKICIEKEDVIMAGFSHYMLDKYLRKLQDASYTAVVYTQDEQKSNTTRSLSGIFSPGTYFSPESNSKITNNTSCIWINQIETSIFNKSPMIYVGVANIDIYTGKSSIFEFHEIFIDNPTTFDELERFISIYQPSEVIIIANLEDNVINKVLNYANIQCNSIHKISLLAKREKSNKMTNHALNCEKQIYQKEILQKFYEINDFEVFSQNFYEYTIATQAFCFLLDFIYQHNPNLVNKISEPLLENCSDRLILANHSLKQLNIIEDNSNSDCRGIYSSVQKMMNICITSMGKRQFAYQLLNPTTNINYLQKEYDMIENILSNFGNYDYIKNRLEEIKDISKINRQIFMKKISPNTIFHFYKNLFVIKSLHQDLVVNEFLGKYIKNKCNGYDNLSDNIHELIQFLKCNLQIDKCENVEIFSQFDENFFQDGVNKELDKTSDILNESFSKLESIKDYFNQCIIKYEKNSKTKDFIKLHETEKNNISIISTKRRCNVLKQCFPNDDKIVSLSYFSQKHKKNIDFEIKINKNSLEFHNQSAANDMITNFEITELCNKISNCKIEMKESLTKVYNQFLEKLQLFDKYFECISVFITTLDIIYSKASLAKKFGYCKPIIEKREKSFVDVKGLRHCIIEQIQQNELYVTNDICLGKSELDGILLYGTNMVGKTSFIRALGIAVIMAQSGLYVPSKSFHFSPYKYIFTRILGNDNIFKGLSTFAVEMSELRTILRLSNDQSLVLGDELCSGTESISAVSIFVAGIQQLARKRSCFIFSTHLHEIINYEEIRDLTSVALKHMAIRYDKENHILIYDRLLRDGPGDNMYGLLVCKALNLPEDFLDMANNIRKKYHPENDSILSLKTSHYNAKKIMSICEICKKQMSKEVHHLQHQSIADDNGMIEIYDLPIFHKNNLANLIAVCEDCHNQFHSKPIDRSGTSEDQSLKSQSPNPKEPINIIKKNLKTRVIKKKTSNGHQLL